MLRKTESPGHRLFIALYQWWHWYLKWNVKNDATHPGSRVQTRKKLLQLETDKLIISQGRESEVRLMNIIEGEEVQPGSEVNMHNHVV